MIDVYVTYLRGLIARGEKGQTMAEYAVVLAVITIAIVAALAYLSGNVKTGISSVAGNV